MIKKTILIFYFSGLLLIPTVLLILPADYFDSGQSVCLSVLLFKKQCFSCGITRAIQHIIHFDFQAAYLFNKSSFIVFSLLFFIWLVETIYVFRKIKNDEYEKNNLIPLSGLVNFFFIASEKIIKNPITNRKTIIIIGFSIAVVSMVSSLLVLIAIVIMKNYKH